MPELNILILKIALHPVAVPVEAQEAALVVPEVHLRQMKIKMTILTRL